jgi:hypothetical protein
MKFQSFVQFLPSSEANTRFALDDNQELLEITLFEEKRIGYSLHWTAGQTGAYPSALVSLKLGIFGLRFDANLHGLR